VRRLVVTLDLPTAIEARRAAQALGSAGAAVRVGARLLNRVGPAVVATLYADADVMVDTRISGAPVEVIAAARSLATLGARWISVEGAVGLEGVEQAAAAVGAHGAGLVATTVSPEAPDPHGARGRAVSVAARELASSGVAALLGTVQDIGVVAQAAPEVPVVVVGAETPAEVADALGRGALAVVVESGIARAADPAAAVAPFVEAAQAA
jgi:orotidine-5'-phosphate decarboxylase